MRSASLLFVALALISSACAPERPRSYYEHLGEDLGLYRGNVGRDPLPISAPPTTHVNRVPDAPWRPEPVVVSPANPGVTPVSPDRLATFLPNAPEGWTFEEVSRVTLATPQGYFTEASRNYWKGAVVRSGPTPDGRDRHQSVGFTIVDRGQTGPFADPTDERTGVKLVPVTVEGFAGDEFDAGPGMKQVQLDVAGRYLVRVRAGHVPLAELRAWAARAKLKELSELK